MQPSSVAKLEDCTVAFYNIGWVNDRLTGRRRLEHEDTLLEEALHQFGADVVLLSECGEIGNGLDRNLWMAMINRIFGFGYAVEHQSHYTSIVKRATMTIIRAPSLQGPLTTLSIHSYRTCQHLQVVRNVSAAKPIDLYNVHSPSSPKEFWVPKFARTSFVGLLTMLARERSLEEI